MVAVDFGFSAEMKDIISHYMPNLFSERTTLFSFNCISLSFYLSALILALTLAFRSKSGVFVNVAPSVFVLALLNSMHFAVRKIDNIANLKNSYLGEFRIFDNLMLGYFVVATVLLFVASLPSDLNYKSHFLNLMFIAFECSLFFQKFEHMLGLLFGQKFHGINAYYPCFFFAIICYFMLVLVSPLLKPFYDRLYLRSYEVIVRNPFSCLGSNVDETESEQPIGG